MTPLNTEFKNAVPQGLDILYCKVDDLSLEDPKGHVIGKITEYVEAQSLRMRNVSAFYQALHEELSQFCRFESLPKDMKELLSKKCITRQSFQRHLESSCKPSSLGRTWETIQSFAIADKWSPYQIKTLQREWQLLAIRLSDHGNQTIRQTIEECKAVVSKTHCETREQAKLTELIDELEHTTHNQFQGHLELVNVKRAVLLRAFFNDEE